MSSIITKRGDDGSTDILFGHRVSKDSVRIEAIGAVDELNSALGLVRVYSKDTGIIELIDDIQNDLIGLMGQLACKKKDTSRYKKKNFPSVSNDDVVKLEKLATSYSSVGMRYKDWARPGAEHSIWRAHLDFAKTIARRAERKIITLHNKQEEVSIDVRLYINRLSDLLWILARSGSIAYE